MGRKLLGLKRPCIKCGKEIRVSPSKLKRGKGKFCSRACEDFGRVIFKNCDMCGKEFKTYATFVEIGKGKYCSELCYRKSRKGQPAWNKGKPATWMIGNKNRLGKPNLNPNRMFGEANHKWRGDEVGYNGLHLWVRRQLGTPSTCDHCGKTGLMGNSIHWANKTGQYLRDKTDWLRLCPKCHAKYDSLNGLRGNNNYLQSVNTAL